MGERDDEIEWRRKRVWDTAFAFAMVSGRSGERAKDDANRAAASWGLESVCDEHRTLRAVPTPSTKRSTPKPHRPPGVVMLDGFFDPTTEGSE